MDSMIICEVQVWTIFEEEDVTYHMKMPTFSSMKWVRLWNAWSLEKSKGCITIGYLSTTNFKWKFYRNSRHWINVAALHRTNTKVPGLHKLQHTSHLQNTNIFSCHEFTISNFTSAMSSANPWVVRIEDEIWTPFFVLASAGPTLWSLNYVLKYLKIQFLQYVQYTVSPLRKRMY
jgi:hypothetical protein